MNAGETEKAKALLVKLQANSDGAPVGLAAFHLVRGEIDNALDSAVRALDAQNFGAITILLRPYQTLFSKSSAWPAVLRKMNLS